MSIELLIGAVVVIAVVAYIVLKDSKETEVPTNYVPPALKNVEVSKGETKVEAAAPAKAEPAKAEPAKKAKKATKKTATKKAAKVDLDAMKKAELLAHAKANGIKANASMNKDAIIAAIKNG